MHRSCVRSSGDDAPQNGLYLSKGFVHAGKGKMGFLQINICLVPSPVLSDIESLYSVTTSLLFN